MTLRRRFLWAEAVKRDIRLLIENKSKFIKAHSSSGHKHALKEVLTDPEVAPKLSDTKALGEVRSLETFYGTTFLFAIVPFLVCVCVPLREGYACKMYPS